LQVCGTCKSLFHFSLPETFCFLILENSVYYNTKWKIEIDSRLSLGGSGIHKKSKSKKEVVYDAETTDESKEFPKGFSNDRCCSDR
jgi:hypothetical protein